MNRPVSLNLSTPSIAARLCSVAAFALCACTDPPADERDADAATADARDADAAGVDVAGETDLDDVDVRADADADADLDSAGEDVDAALDADAIDADADTAPDAPLSPWGIDVRPSNDTCRAFSRPVVDSGARLERVFPSLYFDQPVTLIQAPGDSSRWFVVEKPGRIYSFPNRPDAAPADLVPFADLLDRVAALQSETGLLDIEFHPDFAVNGEVYFAYTGWSGGSPESRVSRFRTNASRTAIIPSSEQVLLRFVQPADNHNGCDLEFGPEGLLYISFGDGGGAGDTYGNGQRVDNWFSAILRIDVDRTDPGLAYAIPPSNPFVDGGGAAEVYAWGLRNPWRMSFDRESGALWVGDVGQDRYEEIDVIERGGNYGWPVYEGRHCFAFNPLCGVLDAIPPVAEYGHDAGSSISGGYVYRGSAIPSLYGRYVFSDFVGGTVWALGPDGAGGYEPDPLFDTGRSIASFAEDADGELYIVDFVGGSLYRLVPDSVVAEREVPTLLSATGCMDPTDPSRPGVSLIPYTINVPFWSDDAEKERWFALPDGAVMTADDRGDLDLPIGSVVVKQFRFDGGAPFETRLLMHHEDGSWGGYSYRWRADGTDAELVDADGVEADVAGRPWTFPSRANCNSCHTEAAGRVLGLEVPQLDRDMVYPDGRRAPQLATLQHIGVVGDLPAIPPMPSATDAASTGDRARAWLHSNCAGCHQPAGPARAEFDLRWTATERNLCNVPPIDDMGIDGARLVAPFAPERSVLLQRALLRGSDEAMPPLGSAIIDPEGTALLERWISSGGCN